MMKTMKDIIQALLSISETKVVAVVALAAIGLAFYAISVVAVR